MGGVAGVNECRDDAVEVVVAEIAAAGRHRAPARGERNGSILRRGIAIDRNLEQERHDLTERHVLGREALDVIGAVRPRDLVVAVTAPGNRGHVARIGDRGVVHGRVARREIDPVGAAAVGEGVVGLRTSVTAGARVDRFRTQQEGFVDRIRIAHVPAGDDRAVLDPVEIAHENVVGGAESAIRARVPPGDAVRDGEAVMIGGVGARVRAGAVVGGAVDAVEPGIEKIVGRAVDPVRARAVDVLDLKFDRRAGFEAIGRNDCRFSGCVITQVRADRQFVVGFISCRHGPLREKPFRGASMQMPFLKLTRPVFSTCP